jgi:hypothetical protein
MHKTSSTQITMLHLITTFCIHPELRAYVRRRGFVSLLGNIGSSMFADRSVEVQNDEQKERGVGRFLLSMLTFTRLLQPLLHVHRRWKAYCGIQEAADAGFRTSIGNEIDSLVRFFVASAGTNLQMSVPTNPFWHTGNPVNIVQPQHASSSCREWDWLRAVSFGLSKGERAGRREHWLTFFRRHARYHMFHKS